MGYPDLENRIAYPPFAPEDPELPLPTLGDLKGLPSYRRQPGQQTYEECQASKDPNVMYFVDPCQGLPRDPSFPFPSPDSKPDSGKTPETIPGTTTPRMPDPRIAMAGFLGQRLGQNIREGDFKGAAGVLVGGLLGSVLGNIIQGRGAFDFGLNKPENDYVDLFPEFIPEPNEEALPKPNPDDYELMGGPNLLGGPDRSTPLEVIPFQQNQELVGPQSQVFPRFADPGNGTLNTTPMMTSQFGSLRNDLQSRLGFG